MKLIFKKWLVVFLNIMLLLSACSVNKISGTTMLVISEKEATDENAVAFDDKLIEENHIFESYYAEPLDVYYYALSEIDNEKYYNNMWGIYNLISVIHSQEKTGNENILNNYGYGFLDLNGDKEKELLIGNITCTSASNNLVYLICTVHNGAPFEVVTGDIWHRYYICEGNKIGYEDNGVNYHKNGAQYKMREEDISLETVGLVEYRYMSDSGAEWVLTDDEGNEAVVTETEAEATLELYAESRITLELKPFSEYEPNMPMDYYNGANYVPVGKEYSTWQEGYLNHLKDLNLKGRDRLRYSLIYVDDDNIPELVIDSDNQIIGCYILSFYHGMVTVFQTDRLYFTYIEKGGLLRNTEGSFGIYYDYIYRLENGCWKRIFNGDKYQKNKLADSWSEDNLIYYIGAEQVSSGDYMSRLKKVYDITKEKEPGEYLNLDEIVNYLMAT